jgi:hypothetical protein
MPNSSSTFASLTCRSSTTFVGVAETGKNSFGDALLLRWYLQLFAIWALTQFWHGAERSHFNFLSRQRKHDTTGRGRFRGFVSSMKLATDLLRLAFIAIVVSRTDGAKSSVLDVGCERCCVGCRLVKLDQPRRCQRTAQAPIILHLARYQQ